ncbi:hypothetical protein M413DRAFT_195292 [Hebeloma cylindrosporum]|uniref:Uncharacterized protein n=1 Tax=Hebeloma cylindrosporum TaxID=76867 RepID=A0A0C3C4L8_HEBCY|nr:hypothetical protein M413DRAFT_195292 [Hebeloma cylindrosporum h7]
MSFLLLLIDKRVQLGAIWQFGRTDFLTPKTVLFLGFFIRKDLCVAANVIILVPPWFRHSVGSGTLLSIFLRGLSDLICPTIVDSAANCI